MFLMQYDEACCCDTPQKKKRKGLDRLFFTDFPVFKKPAYKT